jgi:hypothetical protein
MTTFDWLAGAVLAGVVLLPALLPFGTATLWERAGIISIVCGISALLVLV